MAVMTKAKPKAEITVNDLILCTDNLQLDSKTAKAVSNYINSCLEYESTWAELVRKRQELLEDCMGIPLGELLEESGKMQAARDKLEIWLRKLLQMRFEILPLLQIPYEHLVADTKAELEAAYEAVGDRFQKDGCGIEADLGYRYNPASAKIRFRARCGQQPECLRFQAKLNELECRHAGFLTQMKVGERSRDDTAVRVTRWPAITDGQKQKIARFLEVL